MIREDNCRQVIDIIMTVMKDGGEATEEARLKTMARLIYQYQGMVSIEFTEEEFDYIQRDVEYNFSVTMERGSVLTDSSYVPWYSERKGGITPVFWRRYRKMLESKLSPLVLGRLDLTTSEILDYAGDPHSEGTFQRKGLVVGDVQSGKTNSYLGVICKAIDAGYNFIIILAGGTDSLRTQTQDRTDQGVIGISFSPERGRKRVGVGLIDPSPQIISLTDHSSDFNSPRRGTNINTTTPIVLVIKKFHSILRNVYDWLKPLDKGLIDKSLLLIDDEADYASINTSSDDITTTNGNIRSILSLFARSSYVGYTATPYANIFVNPDSYDTMVKDDLFPKDFIYSMRAPSNYIGPLSIFGENGAHNYMLRTISEEETILDGDLKHKKSAKLNEVPESLKSAIACFFISCTLRDLKGDGSKPMSMMIHITRFIDVQSSVSETINEYIEAVRDDVISYFALESERALRNKSFAYIHKVWTEEYESLDWPHNTWSEIQSKIAESINKIQIKTVNSKNESNIDYVSNPSLRTIVIGGNSLTRGLTLEGLMVSYFYRKSNQYDTLLQMGRWFGYRDGYDVLCRVWTHPDVQNWFGYVGRVNEELRDDIDEMCAMKKTPMEYGMRVQEDITGFMMTSRTKMRYADTEFIYKNLAGEARNTMYVSVNRGSVEKNHRTLERFYTSLNEIKPSFQKEQFGSILWTDINKDCIIKLLEGICIPDCNIWYGFEEMSRYIVNNTECWDVAIVGRYSKGDQKEFIKYSVDGKTIVLPSRKFDTKDNPDIIEMGNRNLVTPGDYAIGLDSEQLKKVPKMKSPSAKDYMIPGRLPLLLIYYLNLDCDPVKDSRYSALKESLGNLPPVGFAFGFPADSGDSTKPKQERMIRYRANVIYKRMKEFEDHDDDAQMVS